MSWFAVELPTGPVAAHETPEADERVDAWADQPVDGRSAPSAPSRTIVSTSGVPHGDVADYRASPKWEPGMPVGANARWRTFMAEIVSQITASRPDVVVHGGDMVEGRWYRYSDDDHVFGRRGTTWQNRQVVQRAGSTIYPWIKSWWAGHDVVWGCGQRRHHYARPVREVEERDLPEHHRRRSALDHRPGPDVARQRCRLDLRAVRDPGGRSEPQARDTSALLLRNGTRMWSLLSKLGVDLLLASEFHADTTWSRGGSTPVQIVHGGRHMRASWLEIDVFGSDHLELTLWESVGQEAGDGRVWAMTHHRMNNGPIAGTPRVTGTATVTSDRRVRDRTGFLREGDQ